MAQLPWTGVGSHWPAPILQQTSDRLRTAAADARLIQHPNRPCTDPHERCRGRRYPPAAMPSLRLFGRRWDEFVSVLFTATFSSVPELFALNAPKLCPQLVAAGPWPPRMAFLAPFHSTLPPYLLQVASRRRRAPAGGACCLHSLCGLLHHVCGRAAGCAPPPRVQRRTRSPARVGRLGHACFCRPSHGAQRRDCAIGSER